MLVLTTGIKKGKAYENRSFQVSQSSDLSSINSFKKGVETQTNFLPCVFVAARSFTTSTTWASSSR